MAKTKPPIFIYNAKVCTAPGDDPGVVTITNGIECYTCKTLIDTRPYVKVMPRDQHTRWLHMDCYALLKFHLEHLTSDYIKLFRD